MSCGQAGGARHERDDVLLKLARLDKSDWRAAAQTITEVDATALGVARVGYWRFVPGTTELVCENLYHAGERRHESGARVNVADYPTYMRALTSHRVIAANDVTSDRHTRELVATYLEPLGITSMMDVPVWLDGKVVGVLCHEHVGPSRTWSSEDEHFAVAMAEMLSLALEVSQRRVAELARQKALEALADERALLYKVLCQIPAVVVVSDVNGRIVLANDYTERAFGVRWQPGDLLVERIAEFEYEHLDGRPYDLTELPIWRALKFGEVVNGEELSRVSRDGSRIVLSMHTGPVRDTNGKVVAAVSVAVDRTEHKRIEQELAEIARMRETFMGVLGHDLRNPLAAIRGRAQLLGQVAEKPDRVRDLARRIDESSARMSRLVSDLLDFVGRRAGQGPLPVSSRPADLAAICQSHLAELLTAHPGARVELQVEGDTRGTWDVDRLGQVISNLVSNALSHGDPSRPTTVRVVGDGDEVRLEVHNEGNPIPPAQLQHLFEPYRTALARGGGPGKAHFGLGLFIVRAAVAAHGGTVSVDSSAERGTTFTVVLPRIAAGADLSEPGASPSAPAAPA